MWRAFDSHALPLLIANDWDLFLNVTQCLRQHSFHGGLRLSRFSRRDRINLYRITLPLTREFYTACSGAKSYPDR
jgi:hypothetical protein